MALSPSYSGAQHRSQLKHLAEPGSLFGSPIGLRWTLKEESTPWKTGLHNPPIGLESPWWVCRKKRDGFVCLTSQRMRVGISSPLSQIHGPCCGPKFSQPHHAPSEHDPRVAQVRSTALRRRWSEARRRCEGSVRRVGAPVLSWAQRFTWRPSGSRGS